MNTKKRSTKSTAIIMPARGTYYTYQAQDPSHYFFHKNENENYKRASSSFSCLSLAISLILPVHAVKSSSVAVNTVTSGTGDMAKPKAPRKALDSYTVKHINKTIRVGDSVLMRPSEPSKPSYVAKIEGIEADSRGGNVRVRVRWYYRPEESIGGRRQFHGSNEVFLSDHCDEQSADTIEAKCTVHSFKSYTKLDAVGNDDFFCRFEYNSTTGAFNPDRVSVYCKCEMPYNPDDLMVQCEGCTDWFHPACIDMTPEEAKRLNNFFCESCSSESQKKLQNSHASSRQPDTKVDSKRRRR